MTSMITFIARMIKTKRDENGLEAGQNKYRAYFVKVKIYEKYREEVEEILIVDGYEDCIVKA